MATLLLHLGEEVVVNLCQIRWIKWCWTRLDVHVYSFSQLPVASHLYFPLLSQQITSAGSCNKCLLYRWLILCDHCHKRSLLFRPKYRRWQTAGSILGYLLKMLQQHVAGRTKLVIWRSLNLKNCTKYELNWQGPKVGRHWKQGRAEEAGKTGEQKAGKWRTGPVYKNRQQHRGMHSVLGQIAVSTHMYLFLFWHKLQLNKNLNINI